MRIPIPFIAKINTNRPTMIIAGKPTAKIFNCGDALATIPRPICIKSMTQRIGIAIKTAPRKIVLLQAISSGYISVNSNRSPMGTNLKLSNSISIKITCPPIDKNISVPRMVNS